MKILGLFLAFSVVLHVLGLIFLPAFDVMRARALEVIPVTVEVWEKEYKKPLPQNLQKSAKSEPEKPKPQPAIPQNKPEETTAMTEPVKIPDVTFTAPSIDPNLITATQSNIDTLIGNMAKEADNQSTIYAQVSTDKQMLEKLKNEIANSEKSDNLTTTSQVLVEQELQNTQGVYSSDFMTFDVYPTNNRRITYAPQKPTFSLPNDTLIKIKITVDKLGNVQNVVLLSRNTAQVERLALDYVENLKFEASDKVDEAQLTLSFKVRGK